MSLENKGEVILISPPKKTEIRARRWCGTWNNYTKENYEDMKKDFLDKNYGFTIGEEVGTSGTPHLQIYFEATGAVRFSTLKKAYPAVHWEKARGTKKQNLTYCTKEGKATVSGMEDLNEVLANEVLASYLSITWKPWQSEILALLDVAADNRSINWYWDADGNSGKSFICKYIFVKYRAIIADGKKDNVFNQILTSVVEHKIRPNVIILDIPRHNREYINYGVIEQIKNGLIYSGKYEGGALAFPSPHIFIFANFEPELHKLSVDRWRIKHID